MRFGLLYLPTYVPELDGSYGEFYGRMLEQISLAEQLGYDSVWLTEHHFHPYGGALPNPAVFAAAIAQRTTRIRIGTAVTVLPFHNPLLVAEDFAMVDVLSNGRLDFGVGRGSVPAEYRQFSLSQEQTFEIMAEATTVILRAWGEEVFHHQGQHFSYPPISLLPRPVQRPHPPIWVGAARTPETFEWAGRNGFHIMVLPYLIETPRLKELLGVYRSALRQAGHDDRQVQVLAKFHVFVTEDKADLQRYASPAYDWYQRISGDRSGKGEAGYWRTNSTLEQHAAEYRAIAGRPDECVAQLRYWQETLGINHLGGTFHFGGLPQAVTLRSIELFAREVAPALRESPVAASREGSPADRI